jgi:hypothetical protein
VLLDLNGVSSSTSPLSEQLNRLIDQVMPRQKNTRQYFGASSIGSECARRVQYDWFCDPAYAGRLQDVFERGHFFEALSRQHLVRAGFRFAPPEQLAFAALDGHFRGHADGVLLGGPVAGGLIYPAVFEHKYLKLLRMLSSSRDGEIVAAVHALRRALAAQ